MNGGDMVEEGARRDHSGAPPAADEAHLDRRVEPEYAAISGWAVFSLVVAAIGVVAMLPVYLPLFQVRLPGLRQPAPLAVPILLVVPLAALVLSLVAIRGIAKSEGTRAGMGAARVALALSLLFLVGPLVYHGAHQYREFKLQDDLVQAAEGHLQELFERRYGALMQEMIANTGQQPADPQETVRWQQNLESLLYSGGEYYGRTLQVINMGTPEDPAEGTDLMGAVIYRLVFKQGGLDLRFLFRRDGSQWRLVALVPAMNPLVAPKEGDQPRKRFD